jgi:hypothetical protein
LWRSLRALLSNFRAASRSNAQGVSFHTEISYDDNTNTVWGYSSTEIDYASSYYYNAYVDGCLFENGQLVDSGSDQEAHLAEVYTSASADPGVEYTLNSYYYEIAIYYYQDIEKSPEGCMPCDGCNTDCYYYYENWYWYDPYGFSFINPGYYDSWGYLYGYGPPAYIEDDEYNYQGYDSKSVTPACAMPTNFRETSSSDAGNGTLHFDYAWDSSSGHLRDLRRCRVGEKVDYSASELPFASPPFPAGLSPENPSIVDDWGDGGVTHDDHSTPGQFVKPYQAATITATQIYRYRCPCHNNNAWETLVGPHNLIREVAQNPNGSWKFTITKTGSSATINPLP